jgi:elongation factor Ts
MVDYKKLKTLREETGVSFSLCKKALEETKNDLEKAKKLLFQWGGEKAKEKAERATSQGGIFSYIHHNRKVGAMVELMTETDFVAKNAEFQRLGTELAMQVASIPAKDIEELLNQEYIREQGKKITDLIKEHILKFGENIKVTRFVEWSLGETV